MISFMLLPENFPFALALVVMFGIAILEGALTLLGAGLSHLIDSILPDSLEPSVEIGADPDVNAPGHFSMSSLLGWLFVGKVPTLVFLVLFLTAFGLSGLVVQGTLNGLTGWLIPAWIAWLPALIVSLYPTRWSAALVRKYLPRDESSAVNADQLVGRVATIVTGTARTGQPAEGRLRDQHGQAHYVMIEPDRPEEQFSKGDKALLVSRNGHLYKAIAPPNEVLID